jgi:hypothetical protein
MFNRLLYKRRKFYDDDFDWNNYTDDSYRRRIQTDIETTVRPFSRPGELRFDDQTGTVVSESGPIHPNQRLILETVGQLKPASVHEAGCGGGDHISTVAALFPDISVTGGDRGATQLSMALERHPELSGKLGLQDLTMPFSSHWPRVELVYCQAVLMHIHTAVSHFVALANLFHQSERHVLLVENVQCHDFVSDIHALHQGGHLPWNELHIHLISAEGGTRGILVSKDRQDFPVLKDDVQLRDGLRVSQRRQRRAREDSERGIFGYLKS